MKIKNFFQFHFSQRGSTLTISLITAIVVGILILSMARIVGVYSHDALYLEEMDHTARLAETGLNECLGKITLDSNSYLNANFSNSVSNPEGVYQNFVYRRAFGSVMDGFYIVTSATRTVGNRWYAVKLHTYAQISNVTDYFAAVNGKLDISKNAAASGGRVYGKILEFETDNDPATLSLVKSAEYVKSLDPSSPALIPALPWSSNLKSVDIIISTPASHEPIELAYPLLFPQIFQSDMDRFAQKAHVSNTDPDAGHRKCDFRTDKDIYPPGYIGAQVPVYDLYFSTKHTSSNYDHIYYCEGDMHVQGIVHGQVLFVATGNIYISSSLVSASTLDPLPGGGSSSLYVGSSTAHQAVLLTPNNVIIENTFVGIPPVNPNWESTEFIQALVMATKGTISAWSYTPTINSHLKLNFTGSMILSANPVDFKNVFLKGRTYAYMDSLKTNPPPDIPALAEIFASLQETIGGSNP